MKKLFLLLIPLSGFLFWAARPGQIRSEARCDTCSRRAEKQAASETPKISGRTPREAAEKYLESAKITVADHHELRSTVSRSPLGASVSYEFSQDGIPIVGMSIRVRLNRDMEVEEVENEYRPLPKADTHARLTVNEVAEQAVDRYEFFSSEESRQHAGKILFARKPDESPELAYVLPMQCGKTPCQVVLRASDGQLLARHLARAEF